MVIPERPAKALADSGLTPEASERLQRPLEDLNTERNLRNRYFFQPATLPGRSRSSLRKRNPRSFPPHGFQVMQAKAAVFEARNEIEEEEISGGA